MSYSDDYMDDDLPSVKGQGQIRVAKNVYRKQLAKKVLVIFGYALLVIVVIYACFAATIIRVIPATNGMGAVPVKQATFPGGIPPLGSRLVVNPNSTIGSGGVDKLIQGFMPTSEVAIVEVHSGPFNKVSWMSDGSVWIDGVDSKLKMSEKNAKSEGLDGDNPRGLKNEYLVECIEGDCTVGSGLIISLDNVYGVPFSVKTETTK